MAPSLKKRAVYALISASVIVGSSFYTPIHAFADAEPSVEAVPVQSITPEPSLTEDNLSLPTEEPAANAIPEATGTQEQIESTKNIDTTADQNTLSGVIVAENNDSLGDLGTGSASSALIVQNEANTVHSVGGGMIIDIVASQPNATSNMVVTAPSSTNGSTLTTNPVEANEIIVDTSIAVTNTIVVGSASGSIAAAKNDNLGSITTGDAVTDIQLLNMANTIIGVGDIYIGSITVFGDLNNDIVLSRALLDYFTQGTPPNPSLFTANISASDMSVISNNVEAAATTGSITIEEADTINDIATGAAQTFIAIKNTNGNYILYGNALLIFVNVLGDWSGNMLGQTNSTVAAISNATDSAPVTYPIPSLLANLGKIAINNTTNIVNDITAFASSGDISLQSNDTIGAVTTGDAAVHVRILNIVNTIVSLGSKLGVLFINVFGNWNGSVVIEKFTPQVTPFVVPTIPTSTDAAPQTPTNAQTSLSLRPVKATGTNNSLNTDQPPAAPILVSDNQQFTTILSVDNANSSLFWLTFIALFSGGLFAANRIYNYRSVATL
jgi:hypothetical protein